MDFWIFGDSQILDFWIFGFLELWIFGFLEYMLYNQRQAAKDPNSQTSKKNKIPKIQKPNNQKSKAWDLESSLLPRDSGLESKVWIFGFLAQSKVWFFGFLEQPGLWFFGFLNLPGGVRVKGFSVLGFWGGWVLGFWGVMVLWFFDVRVLWFYGIRDFRVLWF